MRPSLMTENQLGGPWGSRPPMGSRPTDGEPWAKSTRDVPEQNRWTMGVVTPNGGRDPHFGNLGLHQRETSRNKIGGPRGS